MIEIADVCALGCKPWGEVGGVVWIMGVTSNDADELRGLYDCLPRYASVLEPRGAYNEPGRGRTLTALPPPPAPTLSPPMGKG